MNKEHFFRPERNNERIFKETKNRAANYSNLQTHRNDETC